MYAAHHEWTITRVFIEAGLSAKNTKRPVFQEMFRWARDRKVDVILVDKVGRISRNLADLLNLIRDLRAPFYALEQMLHEFHTLRSLYGALIACRIVADHTSPAVFSFVQSLISGR